MTKGTEKVCMN